MRARLREILRRQAFTLTLMACAAAAVFFPDPFLEWRGHKLIVLAVPTIQLIMYGMGTTLTLDDFVGVVRRPWSVAVGAVLQFTVMPLTALMVAKILGFEGELAAGMVLIGSVAGGMASNVMAYLAKANVALSVTMTCVSTLISPLATPLIMKLLAGSYIEVDVFGMMVAMVKIVVLPITAGLVTRLAFRRQFAEHKVGMDRVLTAISMAAICANLAITIAPNHDRIASAGLLILLSAVLHASLGYSLGYFAAKLLGKVLPIDERDARTISIEVGMQNGGMASALAVDVLKSAVAALPPNAACMCMSVLGAILADFWSKRPPQDK